MDRTLPTMGGQTYTFRHKSPNENEWQAPKVRTLASGQRTLQPITAPISKAFCKGKLVVREPVSSLGAHETPMQALVRTGGSHRRGTPHANDHFVRQCVRPCVRPAYAQRDGAHVGISGETLSSLAQMVRSGVAGARVSGRKGKRRNEAGARAICPA